MSVVQRYQSSFAIGEIDPLLRGRIDINQYYAGVQQAQNVIFEPQGGFSRRPGLKFINDSTGNNAANGSMLIPFEFNTEQTFMIHAIAQNTTSTIRFEIYNNQTLLTNINGSGNDYVDYSVGTLTGVTNFDIAKLNFAQSADTLILVHPHFAPFQLKRGATNTTWTATALSLTVPKHQFTQTTANGTVAITPDGTDDAVTVFVKAGADVENDYNLQGLPFQQLVSENLADFCNPDQMGTREQFIKVNTKGKEQEWW